MAKKAEEEEGAREEAAWPMNREERGRGRPTPRRRVHGSGVNMGRGFVFRLNA